MKTIVQILVVVALGYLFWVYGLPWVQRTVGSSRAPVSSPAPGEGGRCVQDAARASEALYDEMLEKGRTLEADDEWADIASRVDDRFQQARIACNCKLESCVATRESLVTLASLLEVSRNEIRTSQSVPLDQGRHYEQANQRLWEAYDLARAGR